MGSALPNDMLDGYTVENAVDLFGMAAGVYKYGFQKSKVTLNSSSETANVHDFSAIAHAGPRSKQICSAIIIACQQVDGASMEVVNGLEAGAGTAAYT